MFKDWIITYIEDSEAHQIKVNASCILEAIIKSNVEQSKITGCVIYVDPFEALSLRAVDIPNDTTYTSNPYIISSIMSGQKAALQVGAT